MPETKTKPNIARKQRKKPLPTIAGRQFKLVAELEAEINKIRKEYRPHNEPVRGLDGALLQCYMRHHESLEDFEQYHGEMRTIEIRHNFEVPRGCGAPECVQYQIWIIFEDGYDHPFSYKISENLFGVVEDHCAASRRRLKWIDKAARHLIRDQIEEHVLMHLETDGKCEISGVKLNRSKAEAHHVGKSFKWLFFEFITEWCNQTNVNPNSIIVLDTDTVGGKSFEDDMCDAWLLYHARHSRIQVLSAAEHRKQHKGSVQPPWGELFV